MSKSTFLFATLFVLSNLATHAQCTFSVSATSADALCYYSYGGSASLTVSGGTAPFTFMWSNGTTGMVADSLFPGQYDYYVTDASGCSDSGTVTVNSPAPFIVDLIDSASALPGNIVFFTNVNGGVPPYSYVWSTGAVNQTSITAPSGVYTVTVTDANGCSMGAWYNSDSTSCDTIFTTTYSVANNEFAIMLDPNVQMQMQLDPTVSLDWDFGDGTVSTDPFPTHTYANNGLYNVCVYVYGGFLGCPPYCHTIGIDASGNVHERPDQTGFGVHVVPFSSLAVTTPQEPFTVDLFPNPTGNAATLNIFVSHAGLCNVDVYNPIGQTMKSFSFNAATGPNNVTLPLEDLGDGVYTLSVRSVDGHASRAFVK